MKDRFAALENKLSAEDVNKLEQHKERIFALENRLRSQADTANENVGSACASFPQPDRVARHRDSFNRFSSLGAATLACDLTRVITLVHNDPATSEIEGLSGGSLHQDIAHTADGATKNQMATYYRYLAGAVSHFMDELATYDEGEGTVLDNTIVLWTTELATGTHEHNNVPFVIGGGGGGRLDTGKYIKTNGPHNKLLVSLMNTMGVEGNSMGGNFAGQKLDAIRKG